MCADSYFKGHQIYEVYSVSCFGWIVDAISACAVAFGGDPLYLAMKDANPAHLKSQSVDYGMLIHTQLMEKKLGGAGLDFAKAKVINTKLEV